MRGKTFTTVDKQSSKKTIKIGEDYPFTLEIVETKNTNLCSCYITILPDTQHKTYIYEIEEILESQKCGLVLIYAVNIYNQKWLEASTLEDLISKGCLFIPDEELLISKEIINEYSTI